MAAGYESTSTILAYSTYILATKRTIQAKLQAEIDEHQEKEVDYDSVAKMVYMDLFVREVLRMFPISAMALARRCNETTTVCGHKIEKGECASNRFIKQKRHILFVFKGASFSRTYFLFITIVICGALMIRINLYPNDTRPNDIH
jgi:hypothetical protein